ncbi:hypothetical protein TNCV_2410731 [Trichonephila clavipes]|nr:hypothetical protein TNCV_2410731 [Trichonephila clavipes]
MPSRLVSKYNRGKKFRIRMCGDVKDDGDDFLQNIVRGDETCYDHFQPERKSVSMPWKYPNSPKPKNLKAQQSAANLETKLTADYAPQNSDPRDVWSEEAQSC